MVESLDANDAQGRAYLAIKRKPAYDMSSDDMKRLRFELSVQETGGTVLAMHDRHNALLGGTALI
ncbi:MAG: hypothetical protein M1816_003029 [Peltula sp. TS41687]|nr:MAG: hypothetical protein M1816_003029 [Peltula sp. TS41687]